VTTPAQGSVHPMPWLAEVCRRIGINEGRRATMYLDSATPPCRTIAIGFNLERNDARKALASIGVADVGGVMGGHVALTDNQIDALFGYSFAPILSESRSSLAPGIFDAMTDARRFVICDLVFNMGLAGWMAFTGTRQLLNEAQAAKNTGDADAHLLFGEAADHLTASCWYTQVGNRAKRDVAMIKNGVWVDAYGDGSP